MHIQRTYDPHPDLLELRGLERPACSNTLVPRGSHHISSLWSPVVAIGGNHRQSDQGRKPQKQAKPLRPVAAGCMRSSMVRRGSPVRVRKRASICEWVCLASEAPTGASFMSAGKMWGRSETAPQCDALRLRDLLARPLGSRPMPED